MTAAQIREFLDQDDFRLGSSDPAQRDRLLWGQLQMLGEIAAQLAELQGEIVRVREEQ